MKPKPWAELSDTTRGLICLGIYRAIAVESMGAATIESRLKLPHEHVCSALDDMARRGAVEKNDGRWRPTRR
jgi:DNA-binding IclR family transcriptional regulator